MKQIAPLAYTFPLRPEQSAQLVLPMDITDEEADRLAAFIKSLVTPWRVPELEPEPVKETVATSWANETARPAATR